MRHSKHVKKNDQSLRNYASAVDDGSNEPYTIININDGTDTAAFAIVQPLSLQNRARALRLNLYRRASESALNQRFVQPLIVRPYRFANTYIFRPAAATLTPSHAGFALALIMSGIEDKPMGVTIPPVFYLTASLMTAGALIGATKAIFDFELLKKPLVIWQAAFAGFGSAFYGMRFFIGGYDIAYNLYNGHPINAAVYSSDLTFYTIAAHAGIFGTLSSISYIKTHSDLLDNEQREDHTHRALDTIPNQGALTTLGNMMSNTLEPFSGNMLSHLSLQQAAQLLVNSTTILHYPRIAIEGACSVSTLIEVFTIMTNSKKIMDSNEAIMISLGASALFGAGCGAIAALGGNDAVEDFYININLINVSILLSLVFYSNDDPILSRNLADAEITLFQYLLPTLVTLTLLIAPTKISWRYISELLSTLMATISEYFNSRENDEINDETNESALFAGEMPEENERFEEEESAPIITSDTPSTTTLSRHPSTMYGRTPVPDERGFYTYPGYEPADKEEIRPINSNK